MKRNQKIIQDDEIDLGEIIKKLWNEKILILSISLIFMVIGYVYGALQPKIYKTEITIREAPLFLFKTYDALYGIQIQQQKKQIKDIVNKFNDDLKLNLLSLDTLVQFVEETNAINDFKNHLKKKNISPRDYFSGKFNSVIDKKKNEQKQNKYSLTYLQPLPAQSFLNDYIIFAHQKTMLMFKKQLRQTIINEINVSQHHLEIAKKIDLENPILKQVQESGFLVNEPDSLFYKGTKVITLNIAYLNKLLYEVENLTLGYNPILEQASNPKLISNHSFVSIAFALGLFLSFMLIFIRSIFSR